MSEMQKPVGGNRLRLEILRVENCPDFEKLTPVNQYGLQGFKVKNIEGESTGGKRS